MSRPAGSRMKALDANAISVIACLTKPPFALAARVLPRVTAIFALCYNNAGVAAAVMWSSVARGVCYNNAGVGAAALWSRVALKGAVSAESTCSAEPRGSPAPKTARISTRAASITLRSRVRLPTPHLRALGCSPCRAAERAPRRARDLTNFFVWILARGKSGNTVESPNSVVTATGYSVEMTKEHTSSPPRGFHCPTGTFADESYG